MKIIKLFIACLTLMAAHITTSAQEWEQLGNINFNRHHAIGFALDGYGYLLSGGYDTGAESNLASNYFHRYDPVTDSWEDLEYDGPERGYAIGQTYEGKLYFGFGLNNDFELLNDLWTYDPQTETFEELPECPCVGRTHPAFVVVDDKVFVGMGGNNGNLGDWWEYDIPSQTWTEKTGMPGNRHHPYMFVIEDDIYVGSGHRTTWFHYDMETDIWTQISDLDDRVAGTQFAFDGRGYALSGTDNFHENLPTGEFWQYVPEVDSWVELDAHPGLSRWAPASFLIEGYVYLATGYSDVQSEEFEIYRYRLGDPPVNIEDDLSTNVFEIYPSPATTEVNIKYFKSLETYGSISIYDNLGRVIFSSDKAVEKIDITNFNKGLYWIESTIYEKKIRRSFVKY